MKLAVLFAVAAALLAPAPSGGLAPVYKSSIVPIDPATRASMMGVSWHAGCPVPIRDLRLLTLDHWGFDGSVHPGRMIVHRDQAVRVRAVFRKLFYSHFPMRRMQLIDVYGGDDHRSMAANNTSAFNCRFVSGTSRWSMHAYGRAVDLKPLRQIAQDRNITIIEDAAQAHGAFLDDGKKAGTGGRVNCFSFYCSKNLGAYGEAGGITTNDDRLAEELRALREHGQSTRYYHPVVGYNARLDEIQAAILRIKLKRLDQWNNRRRELARMYDERLKNSGVTVPEIPSDIRRHVFYTYTIRVGGGRRDDLRKYLGERGIGTQIHYPVPIHLQQSAEFLGYRKGDMPVTEKVASEVLSLPMFAELTDEQLERVADSVRSFMKGN